ncbi:MAG: polysaccharide deacetylase family protein [Paludibacteraceae bacterium]
MFRKVRRIGKQLAENAFNVIFNRSYGTILMLHRIGDTDPAYLNNIEHLKVSVDFLQRYVDVHRDTHDFISLDEAIRRILTPSIRRRPFICFTFDDGFRDNLMLGLPFFEKNQIPFTVFLTVGFIEQHPGFNWPFVLERMIVANSSLSVDGQQFACVSREEKESVFRAIKGVVQSWSYEGFEEHFRSAFSAYLNDALFEDLTMSWDEVRMLAASPLCTIGAHSMTHCRLSNVPARLLDYELQESKRRIEKNIGCEVRYLSYPFGWVTDVNADVYSAARAAGYSAAFISWGGSVRKYDHDIFNIKRQILLENE